MPKKKHFKEFQDHMRQVTAINNEAIRRLANCDAAPPLELAAMFEDIANLYLDFSEMIRQQYLVDHPAIVLPFRRGNSAEGQTD